MARQCSSTVTNSGDLAGTYIVTLKINGTEVASKSIRLEGKENQKVTFTTTGEVAGTYQVAVNNLTGNFVVKAPLTPVPTPSPAPAPAPPPAPTPTPPVPVPPTNWLLVGIIGAAVAIIMGFVLWYAFRVLRRGD